MADEETSEVNLTPPSTFLEVTCKSSGRKTRYAAGTKAGFAVNLINRKLDTGSPLALHIEGVKEGEEPVHFGPDAVLVNYGNGWKLQTVTEIDCAGFARGGIPFIPARMAGLERTGGTRPANRVSQPGINCYYIARILVAFIIMFMLGAILTVALENLPRLILFINSSM